MGQRRRANAAPSSSVADDVSFLDKPKASADGGDGAAEADEIPDQLAMGRYRESGSEYGATFYVTFLLTRTGFRLEVVMSRRRDAGRTTGDQQW